ncbi:MAG: phosphonoacetaldehyde reductase [Synergistaceae bacterium]|nr:phosphonoacetaldehyde reductase [Synergistaceae bacterium]
MQRILDNYEELAEILNSSEKILFVHGKSANNFSRLSECLSSVSAKVFHFTGFTPNPKIEDAEEAVRMCADCDCILAVGGGSAIDTAKYAKMKSPGIPLIAVPTTAGSGSEATRFAVLYEDGRKLSITDDSIIPDYVMFDPGLLKYLPEYHRKSSALDAMSHALESFWSVNATPESRRYSRSALSEITRMLDAYPASYDPARMLEASYTAGKAINISQTTAGHAMCYKITGIFGTAHGHSAAMCNRVLFRWLCENSGLPALDDIAGAMGCESKLEAAGKFAGIFSRLDMEIPKATDADIEALAGSVNPERLKNFPVRLSEAQIVELYREILDTKE